MAAGVQQTLDKVIDRIFLRFIPRSVRPNYITIIRLLLVPVVYWLLISGQIGWGLVVFILAATTDALDGAMARTRNQITDLGKMLDPVADKLLIVSVLLYIGFKYLIVMIFVVFIILEVIAVTLGYFLAFATGKPIGSNVFGKIKLIIQAISIALFMFGLLISNQLLMKIGIYMLFIALFFAVLAALEVARLKVAYINDNKIDVSRFKKK